MNTQIANSERGRSSLYVHKLNMAIVQQCARRRQRYGDGEGARLPLSMTTTPAWLEAIKQARPGGGSSPVASTAVRALPRTDPHWQAADILAGEYERIGTVQGGTVEGDDTKGGQSNGGVTTRVKHA